MSVSTGIALPDELRWAHVMVTNYWQKKSKPKEFVPGVTPVNYSTPIFDENEFLNLLDVMLSGHVAAGKWTEEFRKKMLAYFGCREFLLVNSGSSANLLMVATICSQNIEGHLKPGDEVIMPALGFPTTLAPVIQHGLIPVFVDVEIETLNPTIQAIKAAWSPHVKAVFLPHPLGFPFDAPLVREFCQNARLWMLEDACDSLAATVDGKLTGTFGDVASLSFFPAHFITAGEGGGVIVNNPKLCVEARSLSEWGRACYCSPGVSNTCGKRFGWDLVEGFPGWDHKYCYTSIGYNLKATDMQAALLCAQADKIEFIVKSRRENYWRLRDAFDQRSLSDHFRIHGCSTPRSVISPYAFPITCKDVPREAVIAHLEAAKIETRPIFAGNILRHPGYRKIPHRVSGSLENTDRIMRDSFFVGVHPRLGEAEMDYVAEKLKGAVH